jgi:adenine-specific DNA-methyltransferase
MGKQNKIPGIITQNYAPADTNNPKKGERRIYTHEDALFIDGARAAIDTLEPEWRKYVLAPLLVQASVHMNTSGGFKGCICSPVELPVPIFAQHDGIATVFQGDAAEIAKFVSSEIQMDVAYLDPPYGQHFYGSNHFILNLILENKMPEKADMVNGIPTSWNRSEFNQKRFSSVALTKTVKNLNTPVVMVSFNSEGFLTKDDIVQYLELFGKVTVLEKNSPVFQGSHNLENRKVKEYLFVLTRYTDPAIFI